MTVEQFLKEREVAAHVIDGGVADLLRGWEAAAQARLRHEPPLDEDDYLNDMDGRQLLHELDLAGLMNEAEHRRLHEADRIFITHTRRSRHCLWGERTGHENGWTREVNWWYFRRPLAH